jgi:hypothetical protein
MKSAGSLSSGAPKQIVLKEQVDQTQVLKKAQLGRGQASNSYFGWICVLNIQTPWCFLQILVATLLLFPPAQNNREVCLSY